MNSAIKLEESEIEIKTLSIPQQAKLIEIKNPVDYGRACELLISIKGLRKEIDDTFDPIIKKAHEAHKEAIGKKKKVDAPLVEAEQILKPRIAVYLEEQEKKRREQEIRLRQEAMRKAEEERLAQAVQAEQFGMVEEAELILNQPVQIPPPVIAPSSVPKIAGISIRKSWKFEVVNPDQVPNEYKTIDTVKIGQVVRALGNQCRIPGVRVFEETNIPVRGL